VVVPLEYARLWDDIPNKYLTFQTYKLRYSASDRGNQDVFQKTIDFVNRYMEYLESVCAFHSDRGWLRLMQFILLPVLFFLFFLATLDVIFSSLVF
jgi:hypothetical protein